MRVWLRLVAQAGEYAGHVLGAVHHRVPALRHYPAAQPDGARPAVCTLSFAEDLSLLLLDESSGVLYPLPGRTLDFGLATAALLAEV